MRVHPAFALLLGGALLVIGGAGHAASAQDTTPTGDAAHGKALFVSNGCWECHGHVGQGNFQSGPAIAPHPLPYAAFSKQVRTPRAAMPPYGPLILSDQGVADIYAYLRSITAKPASEIALLGEVDTGKPAASASATVAAAPSRALSHGRALFGQNCSSCHGAAGTEGGSGPSLAGERSRKNLAAAITWIENPQPPMPKLYPAPLTQRDVEDVAAYVESL
jgi:ubiquinol-cytochrome c reductase cytochrome c subunit